MTVTDLDIARRRAIESELPLASISAAPRASVNAPAVLTSAALASPTPPDVAPLCHRSVAADVVRLLIASAPRSPSGETLLSILCERGTELTRPLSAARYWGAVPTCKMVTIDVLRKDNSPAARLALAALGEIDWNDATDAERRVILLRAVVAALSGRTQ